MVLRQVFVFQEHTVDQVQTVVDHGQRGPARHDRRDHEDDEVTTTANPPQQRPQPGLNAQLMNATAAAATKKALFVRALISVGSVGVCASL